MTRAVDDFISKIPCEEDGEPDAEEIEELPESLYNFDPVQEIAVFEELSDDDEILETTPEQDQCEMETLETLSSAYRVHCVAHKLQLGINDFLWKDKSLTRLVIVAQKLAAKLRSPIIRNMISSAKLNQAVLDQKTRWNSTYLMIVRLMELKEFCELNAQLGFKGLDISTQQWQNLQELRDVLKPVSALTTRLQHEQLDVTQFVALWRSMFELDRQKLQGSNKAAKLRKCLEIREKPVFENPLIQCGIFLDKRFNLTLSQQEVNSAKAFILQVWKKQKILAGEDINEAVPQMTVDPFTETDLSSVSDHFELHMAGLDRSNHSTQTSQSLRINKDQSILETELLAFESLPRLPVNSNILEFWKIQKSFPVLKNIAFDIISVPVTEVSVERMFSHLNFILNAYRSSLKADLLEDILLLRMNEKFLK